MAVFTDKAPFGYVDKDGKNQGYDIVFAERLAKDLGVKPEYTSVDPAARVDVLSSNKVDVVLANFTVTDDRARKVDFAKPYMKVYLGVVPLAMIRVLPFNSLTSLIGAESGETTPRKTFI